jgi:hypothetical protein
MLAGETVLSFVFRWLNFAVLIALFVYLFRRHVAPALKAALVARELEFARLQEHKEQLSLQQKQLEQTMAQQALQCQQFTEKIARWRAGYEHEQQLRAQEQALQFERQQKKKAQQDYFRQLNNTQKLVMPQVLQQVHNYFEHEYRHANEQLFMQHMFDYLERGKL